MAESQGAQSESSVLILRKPTPEDGPGITALIRGSPPLDANSAYCHLLQCTHFAETCVVAERSGVILGWVGAHRPPSSPHELFVWQIAVDPQLRGGGLARRMLETLADRESLRDATALTATITPANAASWALFTAFARTRGAQLSREPLFERDRHFGGAHDTEWLVEIEPLNPSR